MKTISLTNSPQKIVVDDGDYEWLSRYKWRLVNNSQVMASNNRPIGRMIMNPEPDQDVDHINHDHLDNRRSNLRVCSHQENTFNHRHKSGPSGYIGVTFHKATGKWRADISIDYKTRYIGLFSSPEEAAQARDQVAKELHGEFAKLNLPH
jgi:HNH endonuclease